MAKKISALVIPAVIDTTGIDKGISSIKTKLAGVRGSIGTRNSGTGGVGGGGNFGAGLPHYGGSAIATGAAAAVGAAVGGRGGTPMSAFRLRMERANRWGEGAVKHVENFRSAQSNRVSQFMWNAGSKVKAAARYSQGRLDDEGVPPGTDNFQMRTNNIRRMNSLGSGLQRFGGATGRGFTSLKNFADFGGNSKSKIGIPGLAIGAAGALGAANYMRQSFTQGGIKSNFSDISNLEGNTALYERAAAIKRRTFGPTGTPTFAQSMVLGAEDWRGTAGGGSAENLASKTDTLIAGAGNLLGQSLESNAGIILGAVDMIKGASFGGAQQFASNTMTSILRKIFN